MGFPGSTVLKNPPANAGDAREAGLIPGSGKSPGGGHGNPLQYSCLENSMDCIGHGGCKELDTTEQLSLSFKTILLDCIVTSIISACIKKLIKIGEFLCSHFNIEDEKKKKQYFQYIVLLLQER